MWEHPLGQNAPPGHRQGHAAARLTSRSVLVRWFDGDAPARPVSCTSTQHAFCVMDTTECIMSCLVPLTKKISQPQWDGAEEIWQQFDPHWVKFTS